MVSLPESTGRQQKSRAARCAVCNGYQASGEKVCSRCRAAWNAAITRARLGRREGARLRQAFPAVPRRRRPVRRRFRLDFSVDGLAAWQAAVARYERDGRW